MSILPLDFLFLLLQMQPLSLVMRPTHFISGLVSGICTSEEESFCEPAI